MSRYSRFLALIARQVAQVEAQVCNIANSEVREVVANFLHLKRCDLYAQVNMSHRSYIVWPGPQPEVTIQGQNLRLKVANIMSKVIQQSRHYQCRTPL